MFPPRSTSFLQERLLESRALIAELGSACDRPDQAVQLLPVTKAVDADTTANLFELGEREFAENRADNLVSKAADLADRGMRPTWHFIGPLQRNKARRVVRCASVLHSVHSTVLLETLQRIAAEEQRELGIYLQVHLSGDSAKQGFEGSQLLAAAELVGRCPNLSLLGLMTMAPLEDPHGEGARRTFERCAEWGQVLQERASTHLVQGLCRLSMGMSRDIRWAIPAGSTLVRVGSALFR